MDGMSIRWMLNMPSFMRTYKNKSTWNHLMDTFRVTPISFFTLRKLYMVLNKLLKLGMKKWIPFFTLDFLDVILAPIYTPRKQEAIPSSLLFMLINDDLILTCNDTKFTLFP